MDTVTFLKSRNFWVKIDDLFLVTTRNSNKATHLNFRDNEWLMGFTINNIAHDKENPGDCFMHSMRSKDV